MYVRQIHELIVTNCCICPMYMKCNHENFDHCFDMYSEWEDDEYVSMDSNDTEE